MVIAITCGRHYRPTPDDMAAFWSFWHELGGTELVHGDYPDPEGGDRFVAEHVHAEGYRVKSFPVDRRLDGDWPAAGPRRNRRMLRVSGARALIHFPGGKGTRDCIKAAKAMRLVLREIPQTPLAQSVVTGAQ